MGYNTGNDMGNDAGGMDGMNSVNSVNRVDCPLASKAHAFLDKDLASAEALEYQKHLPACSLCGGLVEDYSEQKDILARLSTATVSESRYRDKWLDIERTMEAARQIAPLYRIITVMSYGFLLLIGLAAGSVATIAMNVDKPPAGEISGAFTETGGHGGFVNPVSMGKSSGRPLDFRQVEELTRNYNLIATELRNIKQENLQVNTMLRNWDTQERALQTLPPEQQKNFILVTNRQLRQINADYQRLQNEYRVIKAQNDRLAKALEIIQNSQNGSNVAEDKKDKEDKRDDGK